MKSKIICLIKSARAGGSTFAQKWLQESDPDGFQRVVVNGDNIRLSLYNKRYCSNGEGFVHAIEEVMIRSLLMNENQKLLLDDTHTTKSSIKKVLQLDIDAEFIFIDTPKDVCYERARATNQEDLITKGVIDRHFKNLIELSEYGVEKHNELKNSYPNARHMYSGLFMIFEEPNKEFIMEAVEGIRREIKCHI